MSSVVSLSRSAYIDAVCPITLDAVVDLPDPCRILPCGHFFSEKELTAWRAIREVCPMDGGAIREIKKVQFVDSVEEAGKEMEDLHIAAASKSDAVAAKQLLQKEEKKEISSVSSASSLSESHKEDFAIQNSAKNLALEESAPYLEGVAKEKKLRFFEKSLEISLGILSSIEHLINVRIVTFQFIPHVEYTGLFIDHSFGEGSQWKFLLRNDGYQGCASLPIEARYDMRL